MILFPIGRRALSCFSLNKNDEVALGYWDVLNMRFVQHDSRKHWRLTPGTPPKNIVVVTDLEQWPISHANIERVALQMARILDLAFQIMLHSLPHAQQHCNNRLICFEKRDFQHQPDDKNCYADDKLRSWLARVESNAFPSTMMLEFNEWWKSFFSSSWAVDLCCEITKTP